MRTGVVSYKKRKKEVKEVKRYLLCSILDSEKEVNLTVIKSGECKCCLFLFELLPMLVMSPMSL